MITNEYLLDASGAQLIELDGSGNVLHTNLFANGKLLATYKNDGQTYFHFSDWLGTRRYQTNAAGDLQHTMSCTGYPFGDGLNCTGSGADATEHHFTGKERDTETGLDYFGARYNTSSMGRFMSPDSGPYVWSDPQTLNRYPYTRNNPLKFIDPSGKYFVVAVQDQKFYQEAITDLYRRPGGRELVNSLAGSNRPILLDRRPFDTAHTGHVAATTPLAVSGQSGVSAVHVTIGTDVDLAAGAKLAPGKVSPDITTGHELEHANDAITKGQTSFAAGAAAAAAGDAPTSSGATNTIGGTAQERAEEIMGEKTDMSRKDAGAAVTDILKSGQQQWQNDKNKSNICVQNQEACQ